MTLCVAIEAKDAIVLAADSRGLFGDPSMPTTANDTFLKIQPFIPGAGLAIAGSAEFANTILDMVRESIAEKTETLFQCGKALGLYDAINILRDTAVSQYNTWFGPQVPFPNRPPLIFTVCGFSNGSPHLYTMMSMMNYATGRTSAGFVAIGVGMLAIYILNRFYQKDISCDAAARLAYYVTEETASQDGKVGGPIRIGLVRPDQDMVLVDVEKLAEIEF